MSTRPQSLAIWLVLVLSSLALFFAPRPALAAKKKAEPPRVAFFGTGPDLKPTREAVKRLLPDKVELDQGRFTRELQKGGPLGPEFDKSPRLGNRVKGAIDRSKVSAAVLARTYKKKKDRMVHVLVFVPGSTEPEVDETIKLGKKNSESEWVELNDAVFPVLSTIEPEPEPEPEAKPAKGKGKAKAKAKAEPKPKKAAKKPKEEPDEDLVKEEAAEEEDEKDEEKVAEEDEKDDAKTAGKEFEWNRAFVIVGVALGGGGRSFGYSDAVSGNLRDYSTGNLLSLGGRLELYPFANNEGFVKNLGLAAKLDWGLPAKGEGPSGAEFDGKHRAFEIGARYRIPISRSALGFGLGFGKESFSFSGLDEEFSNVAAVDYTYLRLGVDGRFPIGPVALLVGAGYRLVLSGGTVADNFADASITGLDARLGVALPLGRHFEAFLAFRYARYGYSVTPSMDFVAGGAVDQFYALELGINLGL